MFLRIDRVPRPGILEPPGTDDIEWCLRLTRSSAVLWRAFENPLVHQTRWYQQHKRDKPHAILSIVRATPCASGGGIELAVHSVDPTDAERLARGMAEAVVDYAMECELNGRPGVDHPRHTGPTSRPGQHAAAGTPQGGSTPAGNALRHHIRVMIPHDNTPTA